MRTTMTLDEDVAQAVHRLMRERGATLKDTVNDLLRRGLGAADAIPPYVSPTFHSGVRPGVDLDRAWTVLDDLDRQDFAHELETGQ